MWEAVAAPGRLADLERAAAAAAATATVASAGHRVEASTDGVSRVVMTAAAEDEPPAYEATIDPALFSRAHAWVFTRLDLDEVGTRPL